MRALVQEPKKSQPLATVSGLSIEAGLKRYGHAIAQNPWLDTLPLLLESVVPCYSEAGWWLVDPQEHQIPISTQCSKGWEILAFSGGSPVKLYGEWDGVAFLPLGLWVNDQFQGVAG